MSQTMTELIEKQINSAAEYFSHADSMLRATGRLDGSYVSLMGVVDGLLGIVQQQQQQIRALTERIASAEADVCELIELTRDEDACADRERRLKWQVKEGEL